MFGDILFGDVTFANSEAESATTTVSLLPFDLSTYIPSSFREDLLFKQVVELLDYMLSKYYYPQLEELANLYDVFNPRFDSDAMIDFIGGTDFFIKELNDDEKRSLALMLSSLYEIKGMRKGIEGILGALGFPATMYEFWEVQQEIETLRPSRPGRRLVWRQPIPACTVAIVFDVTGKPVLLEADEEIRRVLNSLLWVCARLGDFIWTMNFREDGKGRQEDFSRQTTHMAICSTHGVSGMDPCDQEYPKVECEGTPVNMRRFHIFASDLPYTEKIVKGEWSELAPVGWIPETPVNSWSFDGVSGDITCVDGALCDLFRYALTTIEVLGLGAIGDPDDGELRLSMTINLTSGMLGLFLVSYSEDDVAGAIDMEHSYQCDIRKTGEYQWNLPIESISQSSGRRFVLIGYSESDTELLNVTISDLSWRRYDTYPVLQEASFLQMVSMQHMYFSQYPLGLWEDVDFTDVVNNIMIPIGLPWEVKMRVRVDSIGSGVPAGIVDGGTYYVVNVIEESSETFIQISEQYDGNVLEIPEWNHSLRMTCLDPSDAMTGIVDESRTGWILDADAPLPDTFWHPRQQSLWAWRIGDVGGEPAIIKDPGKSGNSIYVLSPVDLIGSVAPYEAKSGLWKVSFIVQVTVPRVFVGLSLSEGYPNPSFFYYSTEELPYFSLVSPHWSFDAPGTYNVTLSTGSWIAATNSYVTLWLGAWPAADASVSNISVEFHETPTDLGIHSVDTEDNFVFCEEGLSPLLEFWRVLCNDSKQCCPDIPRSYDEHTMLFGEEEFGDLEFGGDPIQLIQPIVLIDVERIRGDLYEDSSLVMEGWDFEIETSEVVCPDDFVDADHGPWFHVYKDRLIPEDGGYGWRTGTQVFLRIAPGYDTLPEMDSGVPLSEGVVYYAIEGPGGDGRDTSLIALAITLADALSGTPIALGDNTAVYTTFYVDGSQLPYSWREPPVS